MRVAQRLIQFLAILSVAAASIAQTTPTPPLPPDEDPPPSLLAEAADESRPESLPNVNIYLPEGQASIRLRKLIRNVLFESQIDYEFVSGDISTYLRYKYYSRNYTYRIGVFDSIEFPDLGETDSTTEFERTRGALFLVGVPRDYNRRYFWLVQGDNLSFGDLENVDNKKKNFYTKLAYQFGTQFDERMNSIAGETRGRITPVLTAFREIGPQRTGYALALTQTTNIQGGDINEVGEYDYSLGDYRYTKFEAEALRRFDVSSTTFIFSRAHFGAFGAYDDIPNRDEKPEIERYSIPRYEMFRLGGREALRAIDANDDSIGTHEFHLTNEYFVPFFRNRDFSVGPVHWNTMYGIGYVGAGTVGFDYDQITKTDRYVVDAGLGSEMAITVRDFEVLISFIYAHTVVAPDELEGGNFRISLRTVR